MSGTKKGAGQVGDVRPEVCSEEGCEKAPTLNGDGLCLRHKLLRVNIGTVPGGARAERTGIDQGRKLEKNLHRYRDRRQAGDRPTGIGDEFYKRDRALERAHERGLIEGDPR